MREQWATPPSCCRASPQQGGSQPALYSQLAWLELSPGLDSVHTAMTTPQKGSRDRAIPEHWHFPQLQHQVSLSCGRKQPRLAALNGDFLPSCLFPTPPITQMLFLQLL